MASNLSRQTVRREVQSAIYDLRIKDSQTIRGIRWQMAEVKVDPDGGIGIGEDGIFVSRNAAAYSDTTQREVTASPISIQNQRILLDNAASIYTFLTSGEVVIDNSAGQSEISTWLVGRVSAGTVIADAKWEAEVTIERSRNGGPWTEMPGMKAYLGS